MFINKGMEGLIIRLNFPFCYGYMYLTENDMYGQVLLKENMSKKEDEINLPKAVGQKFTFQQLRVRKLMFTFAVASSMTSNYT